VYRWALKLLPVMTWLFRPYKKAVGFKWRMDETYIRIKGQWKYLYRAVDQYGHTIDFLLTAQRCRRRAVLPGVGVLYINNRKVAIGRLFIIAVSWMIWSWNHS
jgi:hypothetical protein